MAAGLGFKTFTTGEVLTAADTNGYLMQGVLVFADAAARDAAITSPQEGQFAYLKDTNVTTYYTGSIWANLDTTGMTNPMTTTGDVIYSSSGSTPARLGIGTAGQVLQVNSGATAPEWATSAAGGFTQLATGTLSGTTVTISSISGSYRDLYLSVQNYYGGSNDSVNYTLNNITTQSYAYFRQRSSFAELNSGTQINANATKPTSVSGVSNDLLVINNYANTASGKSFSLNQAYSVSTNEHGVSIGFTTITAAITSIEIKSASAFSGGTYTLLGLK